MPLLSMVSVFGHLWDYVEKKKKVLVRNLMCYFPFFVFLEAVSPAPHRSASPGLGDLPGRKRKYCYDSCSEQPLDLSMKRPRD